MNEAFRNLDLESYEWACAINDHPHKNRSGYSSVKVLNDREDRERRREAANRGIQIVGKL